MECNTRKKPHASGNSSQKSRSNLTIKYTNIVPKSHLYSFYNSFELHLPKKVVHQRNDCLWFLKSSLCSCYHWNYRETKNCIYPTNEKSTRIISLKNAHLCLNCFYFVSSFRLKLDIPCWIHSLIWFSVFSLYIFIQMFI